MASVSDITTAPSSGLNHVDALLNNGPGWNWLAPARNTLYYTFSRGAGDASDVGSILSAGAFNAAQRSAAASALAVLSQITGIVFVATSQGAAADIHFAQADIDGTTTAGYCSTRWNYSYSGSNVTNYSAEAYVYLDNASFASINANPSAGSQGYEVLLHELGHALGLKHPFADGLTLPAAQDNTAYTLMSYTHSGGPHSTYSPYDLAALMWLYGGDGLGGAIGQGTAGRYLVGSASTDALNGGSGADVLEGLAGNDHLRGNGGVDNLKGGGGIDTALYTLARASYSVTPAASAISVTALAGSEGTDTLEQIERLQFADQSLAFDLDGHAGITAKFLAAVFGQESLGNTRYVGIGLDLLDGGMSQGSLMQLALDSRLGQGFSAEAEVGLLYQNLVGRGPTALELQYWTGALAEGEYTTLSLGLMAAQHDLNLIHVDLVGLAHSGLAFS